MQRRWIEECYDSLDTRKGWMRGAGQERSRQLKWKVDQGRGRPRFGWLDGVKKTLAVRRIVLQKAMQLVSERSAQRELLRA